ELLEIDARLQGGLQPAVLDRLGGAGVDRLLDRLAEQRLAILPLEEADRHLAATETRQLGGARHLGQALVDLGRQVAGGHHDLELALQPVGCQFRPFHLVTSMCLWHFRMVRAEGLEPPRLAAREPKSRVSTNSPTPALPGLGTRQDLRAAPQGPKSGRLLARACRAVKLSVSLPPPSYGGG